jgi:hypothetical protein
MKPPIISHCATAAELAAHTVTELLRDRRECPAVVVCPVVRMAADGVWACVVASSDRNGFFAIEVSAGASRAAKIVADIEAERAERRRQH